MERKIAEILLEIGAVALRVNPPFTWASGRLSPIYCDNRLLMSSPRHRRTVAEGLKLLIDQQGWSPDVIAGTATAGIPHAAWVADIADLPMVYVRGSTKGHGKQNRVEGRLEPDQKVVLIEDLISTGGSSLEAATGIIETGAELVGVAAIFSYGLAIAKERFENAGISCASLTRFEILKKEAISRGELDRDDEQILSRWQENPSKWSTDRGGTA